MPQHVHKINQHYWHSTDFPHMEIRSTTLSTQGYKAHSHATLSIGVINSGQTKLTCNNQDFHLGINDIIILPSDLVHACNPIQGKPRSYHMIYLDTQWALETLSSIHGPHIKLIEGKPAIITDPALATALLKGVTQFLSKTDATELNRILCQVLSLSCQTQNLDTSQSDIARFTKQLLLNDTENPPSLKSLAHTMGFTQETIIRHFRRAYGITPKAFVNNMRIEKAKRLLRNGTDIVQAALDVGFIDQSQFHHAFVRYTAATPKQYQQSQSIFNNTP